MAAFAPPARRGDFLYSSVLYADPGNGNHHPRASVAELAALLRPEAPNLYSKGRKPDVTVPAKDPVWHYYAAQLIHYGLPVTKDKNGAKVRLLNAMNQFKLEVPAWVLKLEGELKKEWEAENRKLKKSTGGQGRKGTKAEKAGGRGVGSTKGAKGDINVTVNLTLPSGLSMVEQIGLQQTNNRTPTKPSLAKRKRADNDVAIPVSTPNKAVKTTKESTAKKPIKKEPVSQRSKSSIKQEYQEPPNPSIPSQARVKSEHKPSRAQSSPHVPSPRVKPDPYAHNSHQNQNTILLSGLYRIDCPTASENFDDYNLDLTLALDSARSIWWATFRWGAWDGIIQMNPGPSFAHNLDEPCSLGWRLRDLETGELVFGRGCTGYMTFSQDQTCYGCLEGVPDVGTVGFQGRRLPGRNIEDDLQDEWDGFVKEAYRR